MEFVKGARVRYVGPQPGYSGGPLRGSIGTMIFHREPPTDWVLVEFDTSFAGGHNGMYPNEACCRDGHGWWCNPGELESAPETPHRVDLVNSERGFKVGDRVQLTTACPSTADGPPVDACGYVRAAFGPISTVLVEFDAPFRGGHNGNASAPACAPGRGWWVPPEKLRLVFSCVAYAPMHDAQAEARIKRGSSGPVPAACFPLIEQPAAGIGVRKLDPADPGAGVPRPRPRGLPAPNLDEIADLICGEVR